MVFAEELRKIWTSYQAVFFFVFGLFISLDVASTWQILVY